MLALRIRKAEVAVKDGRLDEAYLQAVREDVREHRKGQRLITRLTKAFHDRAKKHLNSGNAAAAMADVDRASRLGGNQTDIVVLKDAVRHELDQQQNQQRQRRQKLDAVRNLIAAGNYTMGAKVGEGLQQRAKLFGHNHQDNTLYGIMQDAELQREQVATILARGQKALKSSQWDQALDALDELRRMQPGHSGAAAFTDDLLQGLSTQIRRVMASGRLDQASHLLKRSLQHSPRHFELRELAQVIEQCRTVANSMDSMQLTAAAERLKSLQTIVPQAKWLSDAAKEAETMTRCLESLRTGPLGSLHLEQTPISLADTTMSSPPAHHPAAPVFSANRAIPDRFMLHLDESGSFFVARGSSVTIGKVSSSNPVDVALQSQPGLPKLTIERSDEDYFLTADQAVQVDGKSTTSTLLNNGSHIRLGRRGVLEFSIPNAASTSAAIDLRGLRMPTGNVRRVLLMDDDLVIGPQKSAHIRSAALERSMVLHWRDGELRIRPMARATVADSRVLAMDTPHHLDGLSLVITEVA